MFKLSYLPASVLAIALTASVSWGSYMTSFESVDGFSAGSSPDGVDGWTATSGIQVVNTPPASDGTQSVRIPAVSSTALIFERTFSDAGPTDNLLTFDFNPATGSTPGQRVARFYIFVGGDTASQAGYAQMVLFNAYSGAEQHPWMSYDYTGNGDAVLYSLPDNAWTNGQWNTMQVAFDADTQSYGISINNHLVAPGKPTGAAGATHFTKWNAYDTDHEDIYVDNVRLTHVPEPVSLGLIAMGAGCLFLKRPRRAT
jgi:hypothetical protein